MKIQALVSILVPTYNEEIHIGPCLDSILAQDYKNLEVIVFDDCSKDNTVKVVEGYSDPRIKLIRNPINEKHEKTWNYLLTIAQGEYVKTVCADDLLAPTCVSESVTALLQRPDCVMSFCAKFIIDSRGERFYSPMKEANFFAGMSGKDIMRLGLLKGTTLVGEPNNVLFRASAIAQGVQYHFSNYWMVDPDFYVQLSRLGNFAYVPQRLASFRISLKSWSVLNSYKQAFSFKKYIQQDDIQAYFKFSSFENFVALLNAFKLQFLRQLYYIGVICRENLLKIFHRSRFRD